MEVPFGSCRDSYHFWVLHVFSAFAICQFSRELKTLGTFSHTLAKFGYLKSQRTDLSTVSLQCTFATDSLSLCVLPEPWLILPRVTGENKQIREKYSLDRITGFRCILNHEGHEEREVLIEICCSFVVLRVFVVTNKNPRNPRLIFADGGILFAIYTTLWYNTQLMNVAFWIMNWELLRPEHRIQEDWNIEYRTRNVQYRSRAWWLWGHLKKRTQFARRCPEIRSTNLEIRNSGFPPSRAWQ